MDVVINGYKVRYNSFWKEYQISHPVVGVSSETFQNLVEAIDYCARG